MDPARGEPLHLSISVRRVVQGLSILILAFSLVSFIGQVVSEFVVPNNDYVERIAHWLDVNAEASIPTWYAALALMSCSVLLAIIALAGRRHGRPYPLQWGLLSIGFALLSLEEIIGVHSQATKVLRTVASSTDGAGLVYILVLGAMAVVGIIVLVALFGRFFLHLPRRWRILFGIGLVIYLIGVLASDAVGDVLRSAFGEAGLVYIVVLTLEEALEMIGVLIVIYGLLEYIRTFVGGVRIEVRGTERAVD
jgi:hypothetical protein